MTMNSGELDKLGDELYQVHVFLRGLDVHAHFDLSVTIGGCLRVVDKVAKHLADEANAKRRKKT